jgi:DNA repair protein RecO (recombination protein O)
LTVNAIVLRRKESGESDRRLTVLTLEQGKIEVVAKGARKAASRLAGSSDPLSASVMNLAPGKRNLYVTQAQPLSSFRALRSDFDRLSMGMALVELYAAVVPLEQPDPEAYELLKVSLEALEIHEKPIVALVWSEVKLLETAGFMPQFGECAVSGEAVGGGSCWVSPTAGGYVASGYAERFVDRFQVAPKVLAGLSRIGSLEQPPGNLKMALACLSALLPFWRHFAETALPANEALLGHLKTASEPSG